LQTHPHWSAKAETEAQEEGAKWVEDLLEIVGLGVMAEGIGAAVHIWRAGGRELQMVAAATVKLRTPNV